MYRRRYLLSPKIALIATIANLLVVRPVMAQTAGNPPGASDGTITVTGTRQSDDELRSQVGMFIKKFGVARAERPIARWIDPICPKVYGLKPEHAKLVVDKLVSVAREAGIQVETTHCAPNIAISFVGNGGNFVRSIISKSSHNLAEVSSQESQRLTQGIEPIGWWYSTEVRGKDGRVGSDDPPPAVMGFMEGGRSIITSTGENGSFSSYDSSIISTQSTRAIRHAMIVVDVSKADGFKLNAISAYITMIALAEINYESSPPPESIMSLFSTGRGLVDATSWDMAFLNALYKVPLDRQAFQQRSALRGKMISQLIHGKH